MLSKYKNAFENISNVEMMFKYTIMYTLVYSYYFFPKITFLCENISLIVIVGSLIIIVERGIFTLQILTIGVSMPIVIIYLFLICTYPKKLKSNSTEFINYKS